MPVFQTTHHLKVHKMSFRWKISLVDQSSVPIIRKLVRNLSMQSPIPRNLWIEPTKHNKQLQCRWRPAVLRPTLIRYHRVCLSHWFSTQMIKYYNLTSLRHSLKINYKLTHRQPNTSIWLIILLKNSKMMPNHLTQPNSVTMISKVKLWMHTKNKMRCQSHKNCFLKIRRSHKLNNEMTWERLS